MNKYTQYTFFWDGPFSQWYSSIFELDGQKFVTAEQYMMYKKALAFGDTEIANEVMKTQNPRLQKALGRRVRGFNPDIWGTIARDVVFRGNSAKFLQNPELYKILRGTMGTLIVEASPYDKIWGIGLDKDAAKITPADQWPGLNWLGQICTEVREQFAYSDTGGPIG